MAYWKSLALTLRVVDYGETSQIASFLSRERGRISAIAKGAKRKGSRFTEEEKNRVLDIHLEIMRLVIHKYRDAEERGQVELTTTPFFHPILPLVYDTAFAERSLPGRQFPKRFNYPEDAAAQLERAAAFMRERLGRPVVGLWPSEGSVSEAILPLVARAGFRWLASDEEVLARSLGLSFAPAGEGARAAPAADRSFGSLANPRRTPSGPSKATCSPMPYDSTDFGSSTPLQGMWEV